MANGENTSGTLVTTRARALRVGILGPVGDLIAKVGQMVGAPVGTTLSGSDQEAIARFYESRRQITNVASEITQPVTGVVAANDGAYDTIVPEGENTLQKAA